MCIRDREWDQVPSVANARSDATIRRIVDDLTSHPVCDASQIAARHDVSEVAARRALDQLAQAGVVNEVSAAKNHRIFEAHEVFSMLDDIERDVRLRRPS